MSTWANRVQKGKPSNAAASKPSLKTTAAAPTPSPTAASKATSPPANAWQPARKAMMNNKMTYMLTCARGQIVVLQTRNASYQGVFSSFDLARRHFVLKAVQEHNNIPGKRNSKPMVPEKVFALAEVVSVTTAAEDVAPTPVASTGFKTDTQISAREMRHRTLEKWTPDADDEDEEVAADSLGGAGRGGWDQFKVNRDKFGVKSTYSFDQYSTKVDKSSEFFKKNAGRATAIAREIQGQPTYNPQHAVDRGLNTGLSEEQLYSSVNGNSGKTAPAQSGPARGQPRQPRGAPGSYVIPALRAQQQADAGAAKAKTATGSNGRASGPATGNWSSIVTKGSKSGQPRASPTSQKPNGSSAPSGSKPTPNGNGATAPPSNNAPTTSGTGSKNGGNSQASAAAKPAEEKKTEKKPSSKLNPNAKAFTPSFLKAAPVVPVNRPPQPAYGQAPQGYPPYAVPPGPMQARFSPQQGPRVYVKQGQPQPPYYVMAPPMAVPNNVAYPVPLDARGGPRFMRGPPTHGPPTHGPPQMAPMPVQRQHRPPQQQQQHQHQHGQHGQGPM